jgi:tellurite resistance protein TerC
MAVAERPASLSEVTVPFWAWAAFAAFVVAMLALDLFVVHRRAREVSLREAAMWSAVWVAIGLGFGLVLWAWRGGGTAQSYLLGYLIEKSLSLDNVFVFAVIFSAFAIPVRYQHRVLMLGIIGALIMRAAFIVAGVALLDRFHAATYLFGAMLVVATVKMARGGGRDGGAGQHGGQYGGRLSRAVGRILPTTGQLHGQRFLVRDRGRTLATPLLLALIVVEITDVIFAIDSIPAILAITTDTFVVYTSNVFALLGMRALYFLLAGAAGQFRYLQPGLAVILGGIAVKMLTSDLYTLPTWASPAFIGTVLAVVAVLSARDSRRRGRVRGEQQAGRLPDAARPGPPGRRHEQGPAIGAAEGAGKAASVEVDRAEHGPAFADPDAALVRNVRVPDRALGVQGDAVRRGVAQVGPHPAPRQPAVGPYVERGEPPGVRLGDDQRPAVRGDRHPVGERDVVRYPARGPVRGDQGDDPGGGRFPGHHVVADAVEVRVAAGVHDDLVPRPVTQVRQADERQR